MASIGFVGLGNMGLPMAENLIKAGHRLRVHDLAEEPRAKLAAQGAVAAATAREAAAGAEAIVTMLPAGAHVEAVLGGPDGLIAAAAAGTLLIDCSTIDVATARRVASAAAARGLAMLDAPVSGGIAGAAAATLTFMVGGEAAAFEAARPLLQAMGKAVIHAGPAGAGQAAKICNNLILGISMIGVCEAFALAEQLGLEAQKLFDIAGKSSGQCWSLTSYCPVPGPVPTSPANRDYRPGFAAAMMLKDLRLAAEAAAAAGLDLPLGAATERLYAAFAEAGQGGVDFSGIIRMIRESSLAS
ncbi:MAG: 3-hydroxyisobutyrate dehydrogenase [Dongiaceae bacterium]